ncbi:MAG: ABC transporter ATP-binding protein [Methylobacteriaceae bacterium]|jgi:Cu-processing system ATP-binding protein|nr:ABC transporter ATP-binding protein [Methylobacteriaceae bacterium]
MSAISLHGVGKSYDGAIWAVRTVSFSVGPGETVALVGHNGAGKTTCMKMMLGLIRPSEGTLSVLGENPASGDFAARRRIGFLPENVSFNNALTGVETMRFYSELKGLAAGEIEPALRLVGLDGDSGKRVGSYSKGMRQRLGLAQALIGRPEVLMLDEPTAGLDPALRQRFYEILDTLREGGTAILLSSHALTELEERAGRVVVMNRGMLVADGSLDELRRLARLPSVIRIRVDDEKDGKPAEVMRSFGPVESPAPGVWSVKASPGDKVRVVDRIMRAGLAVSDIDVVPPTLDELYAHFLRSGEGAA